MIFNAPDNCNTDGEDDIFVGGDPANGFDLAQIEAARVSVVHGGDGEVVNPDDGALVPGPATGLEDARTAEVHIVLQDHGQAHDDPELLEDELSGFNTACNPGCVDFQYAIHEQ